MKMGHTLIFDDDKCEIFYKISGEHIVIVLQTPSNLNPLNMKSFQSVEKQSGYKFKNLRTDRGG